MGEWRWWSVSCCWISLASLLARRPSVKSLIRNIEDSNNSSHTARTCGIVGTALWRKRRKKHVEGTLKALYRFNKRGNISAHICTITVGIIHSCERLSLAVIEGGWPGKHGVDLCQAGSGRASETLGRCRLDSEDRQTDGQTTGRRIEQRLTHAMNNVTLPGWYDNSLPAHLTSAPSLAVFQQRLKTFLFWRSYPDLIIWHSKFKFCCGSSSIFVIWVMLKMSLIMMKLWRSGYASTTWLYCTLGLVELLDGSLPTKFGRVKLCWLVAMYPRYVAVVKVSWWWRSALCCVFVRHWTTVRRCPARSHLPSSPLPSRWHVRL